MQSYAVRNRTLLSAYNSQFFKLPTLSVLVILIDGNKLKINTDDYNWDYLPTCVWDQWTLAKIELPSPIRMAGGWGSGLKTNWVDV